MEGLTGASRLWGSGAPDSFCVVAPPGRVRKGRLRCQTPN